MAPALLVGLALLYCGQAFVGVIPQDEGELLAYPWLLAHGAVPYRDVWMMYPPTTYLVLAVMYKLGLPALVAERALGFGVRLLYIWLVSCVLTGSWRRFSALGVALTAGSLFLASADMRAYPWIVALPFVFVGLVNVRRRPALAVCLLFVAGTIRYELGLVGCVALVASIGTGLGFRRGDQRAPNPTASPGAGDSKGAPQVAPTRVKTVGRDVLALAALSLGLAAWYGIVALWAGPAALHDIFVDPVRYIGPLQHSALFPPTSGPLFVPVEVAVIGMPLVSLLAGGRVKREMPIVLSAASFAVLPHFLNTADASHLFSVAALILPLQLVALRDLQRGGQHSSVRWMVVVASATGIWISIVVAAYGFYLSPLSPLSPLNVSTLSQREVFSPQGVILTSTVSEAAADRGVLHYLHTHSQRDDRVFVGTGSLRSTYTMTYLYFLLGLRPATRYLEFENGVITRPSVQTEIVQSLRQSKWVVLLRGGMWYFPDPRRRGPMLLDRAIQASYRPVYGNGTYLILQRK